MTAQAFAIPAETGGSGSEPGPRPVAASLIYFSSVSGNTARFVGKLGITAERIPLHATDRPLRATEPFVLVVPTYGGTGGAGSVPKQVIRFLNDPLNRNLIRGVISAGNTNFGDNYCAAGDIIALKCNVPHLYRFELMGTADDVQRVTEGLDAFWKRLSLKQ